MEGELHLGWRFGFHCQDLHKNKSRAKYNFSFSPLWGHRSIWIDSDWGALQLYFLVVMVIAASQYFACMWQKDKRSCLLFEKNLILQKMILRFERSLLCWGSLKGLAVTGRTWDATQRATHLVVLALCTHSHPDDFPLRRYLAKFLGCHELLDVFFSCQWGKYFLTRQVCSKQSCFVFLIKDALVGLHFSQFCTFGSGLTKGWGSVGEMSDRFSQIL